MPRNAEKWLNKTSGSGQVDFVYSVTDEYDLVIFRAADESYFIWQIASLDEGIVISIDVFGNYGYFSSFADAFSSLIDYLRENYSGKIPDYEIESIPYISRSLDQMLALGVSSLGTALGNMNSASLGGIFRMFG